MKLPSLSGITSAVAPYTLAIKIGLVALAVGAFGLIYYQRAMLKRDVEALTKQRDEVLAVNEAQTAALARLEAQRKVDEQTVTKLMKDLEVISTRDRQARKKLADLERNNADVRAYLGSPVPRALECVFDDTDCGQAGGQGAAPAGGAAPALPATPPR